MFKAGDRVRNDDGGFVKLTDKVTKGAFVGCWRGVFDDGDEGIFREDEITLASPALDEADHPTLRDQFAMAALTGLLASPHTKPTSDAAGLARLSFNIATAMLAAREAK